MKPKTCLLLLAATAPVGAQNFLDPLIVTATRTEDAVANVPYTVEVIGSDFLAENSRRTLPEALQYTPGVLVQKTTHGHGSPFIRGFTGRQNLLLVDGVRLNNSTLRGGPVQYWNTVDALSIDHIELIKSQGSVLYGSDSAGGTLNAFSKSSDFRSRTSGESYSGGAASYEFRANGQGSHIGRLETEAGIGGQFGVWLGLSAKDFGDIEDSGQGRMKGTGYPEEDLDFRFDWAVTADSTITVAHQYVNQDAISRWHRTLNNPGWEHDGHVAAPGKWTANLYDQERSLSYLRYAGENPAPSSFIKRWNATLSYQSVDDSEFQDRRPAEDSIRRSSVDLETMGIDFSLESDWGPGSWVYGFDFYHDEVDTAGSRDNAAGTSYKESLPLADDSTYDLLGVFGQYVWKASESLEITAGARYTHAEAELGRYTDSSGASQTDESGDWDATVGSLRALYRLSPDWSVYGGISQAFRAPNLDDLTGNLTSKSGNPAYGSVDVDPENFLTYEIGTRHSNDSWSVGASVFYTDVSDLITGVMYSATDSSTFTTNASDAYVYGAELEGAWKFHPQWTLSGFTAWQDGRVQGPDYIVGGTITEKSMNRLLPLSGSLALRWTATSAKYWVEGRVLAAAEEDRISQADQAADDQRIPTGGTPGYLVASLRAGWQVSPNLDLHCGVENLADTDYRNHGSGQNEPGLTGIFGMKMAW